jgi:hypothetical protein
VDYYRSGCKVTKITADYAEKRIKKTFQSAQSPLTFDLAEQVGVSTSVYQSLLRPYF